MIARQREIAPPIFGRRTFEAGFGGFFKNCFRYESIIWLNSWKLFSFASLVVTITTMPFGQT